jgi:hypothetical protein
MPQLRLVGVLVMGCTDCGKKGGCEVRKGEERSVLAELLPRIYPTGRWGEPDDAARFGASLSEAAIRRLGRQASEVLQARTYVQAGAEEEPCDYVYALCVGRDPGLWELTTASAITLPDGDRIREKYLRAAISQMAPVATLQEVSFELDRDGDVGMLVERPRNGVYDPILLPRTQKFIDLLVGAGLTYFDFGMLTKPASRYAPGLDDAAYEAIWGHPSQVLNWLFYPQPATTAAAVCLPWSP